MRSSQFRGTLAIAKHETRYFYRDRVPILITTLLPIVILVFAEPIYSRALRESGTQGAQFAITSLTVLFSFSALGSIGASFFRDFNWGTWERARALPVTMAGLLAGKALPVVARCVVQQLLMLGIGSLVFDVPLARQFLLMLAISIAFSAALTALGMVITAAARTIQQVTVAQSVSMIVLGVLGGALSPKSELPTWVGRIAPVSPGYWALSDYQRVLGGGFQVWTALSGIAMLVAMACLLCCVAAVWFRFSAPRLGWG